MTLRNEIFEGLAAAKQSRDLVWDPQRSYAEEMYKVARRENADAEERDREREATIKAGRPQVPQSGYQLPTVASTAMPGTQPTAMDTGGFSGKMPVSATAPQMPRMPIRTPRFEQGGSVTRAGSDPQRSRREKGQANEEFDAEDEKKKYDQSLPYRGGGERNAKGDNWPNWMFEAMNQRYLKRQVDAGEARSRRENTQGGYYGQVPKFADGGMVQDEQGLPYRESQPFDPEGEGYDYDQARAAGMGPDETGHWPSREPGSGLQLKGRKHKTFDQAIETDRMQGYGLEKQNGRYYTKPMKGYADGGMVETDEDRQNEADLIVRSLINRDIGEPQDTAGPVTHMSPALGADRAAGTINREVGEPWTVTGPTSEYQTQGVRDRLSNEKNLKDTQAMDATRMQEAQPATQPRSRLARVAGAVNDFVSPPGSAGEYERGQKKRAAIRAATPGVAEPLQQSEEAQRTKEMEGLYRDEAAMRNQPVDTPSVPSVGALVPDAPSLRGVTGALKNVVDLGSFKGGGEDPRGNVVVGAKPATPLGASTTPAARREINETGGTPDVAPPSGPYPLKDYMPEMAPAGAPQLAPTPVPGPNTAQAMSPESAAAQGDRPTGNVRPPNQTPGGGTAVASNGSAVPAGTNGPPNVSMSTPGGQAGNQPAPPPGSQPANTPSTAPKPVQTALNAGPPPAMKGSLGDKTRVAAYDPVADADDPRNVRAVDAGGRAYSPEEIQQVLGGAASAAKTGPNGEPPPIGQGTVSRGNFNAYVQHHSQGGKFSPGEAMLAGMMSDYRMLLKQGRIQQANMMAYGLIQAASIEAASYGRVAGDQLKQGNYGAALANVVKGANYLPDGLTFKVGPDGKSIVATNNAGEVTAHQPVTPQQIIAMVTGLADGTLLWQTLQSSAAMLQKPDRNVEGRALSNQIKRNNLILQEQKIRKGQGGGGGAAGPSAAATEVSSRLAALGGGGGATSPNPTTVVVNQQGSDDGIVNEPSELSE